MVLEDVLHAHPISEQRMKEVLGHTPLQARPHPHPPPVSGLDAAQAPCQRAAREVFGHTPLQACVTPLPTSATACGESFLRPGLQAMPAPPSLAWLWQSTPACLSWAAGRHEVLVGRVAWAVNPTHLHLSRDAKFSWMASSVVLLPLHRSCTCSRCLRNFDLSHRTTAF